MNGENMDSLAKMSAEELAALGGGIFAYVRKIAGRDAQALLGNQMTIPPDATLYCLYNANGAPISISQTFEAAIGNAMEHELHAALVH